MRYDSNKDVWTSKHFIRLHTNLHEKLRKLTATRKRREQFQPQAVRCLQAALSANLPAGNLLARIVVAKKFVEELSRDIEDDPNKRYFALTLVPNLKKVTLRGDDPIDIQAIETSVREALRGLNYVGAIDLAAYRGLPTSPEWLQDAVSIHAHLLVLGPKHDQMRGIVSKFNRENTPLLTGFRPAAYEQLSGTGPLEWLLYTLKFPVKEYQVQRRFEDGELPDNMERSNAVVAVEEAYTAWYSGVASKQAGTLYHEPNIDLR